MKILPQFNRDKRLQGQKGFIQEKEKLKYWTLNILNTSLFAFQTL